jgi:hypothetical protein
VQAAVDTKHHMIVAHEVTNSVTDQGQLPTMAKAAKEAIQHPKPIVLADRGYFEGHDILECEQAGIATLVPKPLTSNSKFQGRFDKRDFVYDERRDEYRCPAGQIAIRRYTSVERGKTQHRYWTSTHFLTRTLPRVRTEMSLQVLAYNLKRAIKILGAQNLMLAMQR